MPAPYQGAGFWRQMAHPSKLIDKARSGYSIRLHNDGAYQVFLGRPTATTTPQYTSRDLSRARSWIDDRIAGAPKSNSGPTIPASERSKRGQVQLLLRLTVTERAALVDAIDALRVDNETNGQVVLRVLSQVSARSRKKI